MKKLKMLVMVAMLIAFTACQKENLIEEKQELPQSNVEKIRVEHGMLVFDSKESFLKTMSTVTKMSVTEKKQWEENLGFKSYDRVCHEIVDAEILHNAKYDSLSEQTQNLLKITKSYDEYSDIAKKYIEKGIAKVVKDENGEKHLDFANLLFSCLVNEDGFVAFGNNIYQYTETQFKYLKTLNFDKIGVLYNKTRVTNNNELFVTNIKSTKKSNVEFYGMVISNSVDRKKVILKEIYRYYGPYEDGSMHAVYTLGSYAEKKAWTGSWVADNVYICLYGNFQVYDGDTNPEGSFYEEGYKVIHTDPYAYDCWYPAGHSEPTIPLSYSVAIRAGGSNGIGIAIENHNYDFPIYLL
jgi:hypothetical protein